MHTRILALLCACIAILFPGCVGNLDPAETTTSLEVPAADPLYWKGEIDGSVVYRFVVDGDPKTRCILASESTPAPTSAGWSNFIVLQTDADSTWTVWANQMHEARVQAIGTVDTADVVEPLEWTDPLRWEWPIEGFAGPLTITIATSQLEATGKPNFSVRFSCVGAFEIKSLEGGRELYILSPTDGHSGVTVAADALPLGPALAASAQYGFESKAPIVRFLFVCSYFLVRAELQTPDAALPIACDPTPEGDAPLYDETSGPGRFALDYNEVDPFDGGSWGAFMGFHPIASFGEVVETPQGHGHGCESDC